MKNQEAIEILKANYPDACYEQLREAVDMAIKALRNAAELIPWLDECIGDDRVTPIERATLVAVKCKVEEDIYGGNDN